ncbi:peptide chain release factor N(5)-glutamine methyltransferase [Gemmatimonadota bacterium]
MSAVVSTGLRILLEKISERLAAAGIEAPGVEAEGLLSAALGDVPRHLLYQEEREITDNEQDLLEQFISRRLAGEPLQYITGEAAFRLLTLQVDRRALIPRPETEGLVEVALRLMGSNRQALVLDAGTGSGAIALSLAVECPGWRIVAAEVSQAALELARENADRYDVGQIEWLEADITRLDFWRHLPPLDLVVSNPPYVTEEEWDELPREIRDYEPKVALVAGPRGLDVISALLEGASTRVKPGGLVVIEIGDTQGDEVMELARLNGFVDARVAPDLSARPRYLIALQRRNDG